MAVKVVARRRIYVSLSLSLSLFRFLHGTSFIIAFVSGLAWALFCLVVVCQSHVSVLLLLIAEALRDVLPDIIL